MKKFEEINDELSSIFFDSVDQNWGEPVKELMKTRLSAEERPLFKKWLEDREDKEPEWRVKKKGQKTFAIDKNNIDHWEFILKRLRNGHRIQQIDAAYTGVGRKDIDLEITMV